MRRSAVFAVAILMVPGVLGACAKREAPAASPPHPPLASNWAVFDSLDVLNEAVKTLVTERAASPRFYALLDGVLAGEVKAHLLEATKYVLRRGLKREVSQVPSVPRLAVDRLIAQNPSCVVARLIVDYSPVRAQSVKSTHGESSYYALFRHDPTGPDPLGINPSGWRWEQVIREKSGADTVTQRVQKRLAGQEARVASDPPYNACHATAGLADDCIPPAPEPLYPAENDLGRAVVAFLACPVPVAEEPPPDPFHPRKVSVSNSGTTTPTVVRADPTSSATSTPPPAPTTTTTLKYPRTGAKPL